MKTNHNSTKYKTLISTLHTVYRLINSTFELREFLVRFTKLLSQVLKVDSVNITLLDTTKKYYLYKTKLKKNKCLISERKTKINNRIEKKITRDNSVMVLKNILALPLLSEDIIGIIVLKRKDGFFDDFDKELAMTISHQAVMAIKNLELYQEQQKIIDGTIKSMLTLLNSRFPTYTHSRCFIKIIEEVSQQMHLNEEYKQSLKYASMLHDMGKINIPHSIITKSTALTGKEFDVIKQHPVMSAQIIKNLKMLKPAVPIILHHHEKYDGTGYPSNLKGDQIPLGSRIMAVADAFDAMVFGRPYRKKISVENALEEINKNAGTQFDSNIVAEFIKVISMKKIKKILNKI